MVGGGESPHGARVTISSAAVGWMATQLSKSAFVAPIFTATPIACNIVRARQSCRGRCEGRTAYQSPARLRQSPCLSAVPIRVFRHLSTTFNFRTLLQFIKYMGYIGYVCTVCVCVYIKSDFIFCLKIIKDSTFTYIHMDM